MARWWVNNSGASVHYPTKQQAQRVAKQVKGASVSRTPMGGKHRGGGCFGSAILALAIVFAVIASLVSALQ